MSDDLQSRLEKAKRDAETGVAEEKARQQAAAEKKRSAQQQMDEFAPRLINEVIWPDLQVAADAIGNCKTNRQGPYGLISIDGWTGFLALDWDMGGDEQTLEVSFRTRTGSSQGDQVDKSFGTVSWAVAKGVEAVEPREKLADLLEKVVAYFTAWRARPRR